MKTLLPFIAVLLLFFRSNAQEAEVLNVSLPTAIALTDLNVAHKQLFNKSETDGLGGGSGQFNTLPKGWSTSEEGDPLRYPSIINGTYRAGRGESAAQDLYSFGSTWADNDKALGSITGYALYNTKKGAFIINNTGETITDLLISYAGEQWRQGGSGIPSKLTFSYSTVATSLISGVCKSSGVWIKVPELDFVSPKTAKIATELNGNSSENRIILSHKISGLTIPNGSTFWLRWENDNATATDMEDGIAIDDVSITPNPTEGVSIVQYPTSPSAILLDNTNEAYVQNFNVDEANENGLEILSDGTGQFDRLPLGWAFSEKGLSNQPVIVNGKYRTGNGSSSARDVYNFGFSVSNQFRFDRAFGAITGTELTGFKTGALFSNNTGSIITELEISYLGEQWRQGGSGVPSQITFKYSTNANSLNSGDWINVPLLNFTSPQSGLASTNLNGNLAANKSRITHTIQSLNIPNGATFWLCWENISTGNDLGDGLAIDDISVKPIVSAMPITLSSFRGLKKGETVDLNWETLSERENSHFELQRSVNGSDFNAIAMILGKGTSNTKNWYSYIDFNPLPDLSYYRLKQVDYNGDSKTYAPISVKFSKKTIDFNVYVSEENIVNIQVYSPKQATSTLQIIGVNGQLLLERKVFVNEGHTDLKLNRTFTGLCVAVLTSESSVIKKKFVNK